MLISNDSEATVARRLKKFSLFASGKTTQLLPETAKRQLVLDEMAKDPTGRQGPRTIKENLAFQGVPLTRYDLVIVLLVSHLFSLMQGLHHI